MSFDLLTSKQKTALADRRVIMIDNYDSFTYNLVQYMQQLGAKVDVIRNDAHSADELIKMRPDMFVISPGPSSPTEAGVSMALVTACEKHSVPLLGVCLGHQSIGAALNGKVIRLAVPKHGKTDQITHDGKTMFAGVANPFTVTRYHSLVIEAASCPSTLEVSAKTNDGIIMAVRHKTRPIEGVQFHPESILTEHGHALLANFALSHLK
jgi:anthranilate synthase component 2